MVTQYKVQLWIACERVIRKYLPVFRAVQPRRAGALIGKPALPLSN